MKKKNVYVLVCLALVVISVFAFIGARAAEKTINVQNDSVPAKISQQATLADDAFICRRNMMRRMFDDMFSVWDSDLDSLSSYSNWSAPLMNIHQTDESIVISCDLPGMEKENISIEVRNRVLSVSGERKTRTEEKNEDTKYYMREVSYGKFSRSIVLPDNTAPESISADYEDGVLTLTVPIAEVKTDVVKIDVQ